MHIFIKLTLELHLLMVLFGTNLVINISTKALKKNNIQCPIFWFFFVQIRCKFNAYFGWVEVPKKNKMELHLLVLSNRTLFWRCFLLINSNTDSLAIIFSYFTKKIMSAFFANSKLCKMLMNTKLRRNANLIQRLCFNTDSYKILLDKMPIIKQQKSNE